MKFNTHYILFVRIPVKYGVTSADFKRRVIIPSTNKQQIGIKTPTGPAHKTNCLTGLSVHEPNEALIGLSAALSAVPSFVINDDPIARVPIEVTWSRARPSVE